MNEAMPVYGGNYSSMCFVCGRTMQNADKRCHLCLSCYIPTNTSNTHITMSTGTINEPIRDWENEGGK